MVKIGSLELSELVCRPINTLQSQKIGKIETNNDNKGKEWFSRWHELMPIRRWQTEIQEWQSQQLKPKPSQVPSGKWYRDESGRWVFKNNG